MAGMPLRVSLVKRKQPGRRRAKGLEGGATPWSLAGASEWEQLTGPEYNSDE
jgi:hypothetical protein